MQPQIHRPTCNADKCVIDDLVRFHILSMAHGFSMSHRSKGRTVQVYANLTWVSWACRTWQQISFQNPVMIPNSSEIHSFHHSLGFAKQAHRVMMWGFTSRPLNQVTAVGQGPGGTHDDVRLCTGPLAWTWAVPGMNPTPTCDESHVGPLMKHPPKHNSQVKLPWQLQRVTRSSQPWQSDLKHGYK